MEELHSEEAESEVEVNRDLFKDIKFFLHESIKNNFARRNLTRDIKVRRHKLLDLIRLGIDSFSSVETRRNCTSHLSWLRHSSYRCLV